MKARKTLNLMFSSVSENDQTDFPKFLFFNFSMNNEWIVMKRNQSIKLAGIYEYNLIWIKGTVGPSECHCSYI